MAQVWGSMGNISDLGFHSQKTLLEPLLDKMLDSSLSNPYRHQRALFSAVKDQFEFCLAKCRTDSHSVEHENKYKNPHLKYCYGLPNSDGSPPEGESAGGKNKVSKVLVPGVEGR